MKQRILGKTGHLTGGGQGWRIAAIVLLLAGAAAMAHAALPKDANGWTIFTPSDTVQIYVSSSVGSDTYNGLYPDHTTGTNGPKATVAAGLALMRGGKADWLYLRRGDTWIDPGMLIPPAVYDPVLGSNVAGGPDAAHPALIGSYGTSTLRPLLKYSTSDVVMWVGNMCHRNMAWVGLNCYAYTRDPASPDYATMSDGQGHTIVRDMPHAVSITGYSANGLPAYYNANFLFEDCIFNFFSDGFYCQGAADGSAPMQNVTLRRSVVSNSYTGQHPTDPNADRSSGVWCYHITGTEGFLIEESVFYHNGWNTATGYGMNIYSHNLYLSEGCNPMRLTGNISCLAGSHGAQMRAGGIADNNLFIRNPIGLFMSGLVSEGEEGLNTAQNNVFMDGIDIQHNDGVVELRGWGFDMNRTPQGLYLNNIAVDRLSANLQPAIDAYNPHTTDPAIPVTGNIVRDWLNASGQGIYIPTALTTDFTLTGNIVNNKDQSGQTVTFVDPNRDMDSYMTSLGVGGGWQNFINLAIARPVAQWQPQYSADGFNDYMRAGYTLASSNHPPVAVNDSYTALLNHALTPSAPGVLGNDTDQDNNPLTASLVSGVAHGTLTLNANGSFTYTPTTGYTGSDSFVYRAYDGTAYSANATVTITVSNTLYVDATYNSGTPGWGVDHFATVSTAMTAASSGVTIIVNPGTYTDHIVFGGKNVILTSTNPDSASVVAATILDGGNSGTVVSFVNGETSAATIKGFTIQHGATSGINCSASPTIAQNVIQNNTAATAGGGINVTAGTPTILRNTIASNTAASQNGGGIFVAGAATIKDNLIRNNYAYCAGGGIYVNACSATITGNTVVNNSANNNYAGGGIGIRWAGTTTITNCILWGNTASGGGAQLWVRDITSTTVSYSDVSGGQAGVYVQGTGTLVWGAGNLNSDPVFVNSSSNFHLQSSSPCIDAANGSVASTVDLEGNARNDYAGKSNTGTGTPNYVDLGCYEYH